jgi:hypothetical protein
LLAVTADPSIDPALQRAWMHDVGSQAIQALQTRTLASRGN